VYSNGCTLFLQYGIVCAVILLRILLIEDDPIVASGLVYALENEGFFVSHARGVVQAREAMASADIFDLAIIDIGLPDGTGFALVEALKAADTSLLFLSAVDEEGSIVRAFEGGAQDYITKPFRLGELMARVKAVLRRRAGAGDVLKLGNVSIHVSEGKAFKLEVGDKPTDFPIDLTALEYRLLVVFATHKGQLLSRGQILNLIWDSEGVFVEDNTLTVYVKRLREKLGTAAYIETVRGAGYRANAGGV